MPGVYVFPGGGLDREDFRPSGFPEPLALPPSGPGLDRATLTRLSAFARTALRELWEETGYLIGKSQRGKLQGADRRVWRRYANAGLVPEFAGMRLAVRAITPARHPIRFHTRFFVCDGPPVIARDGIGDGELEDISWQPVEAVLGDLPTPGITERVLREALQARLHGPNFPPVRYVARGERLYLRDQGLLGA